MARNSINSASEPADHAMQDKYINPFTDVGFKKLFSEEPHKDLLISFLNSLLPEKHQIRDLQYIRNEQQGASLLDRKAIFDLSCVSPNGERFIVELQKAKQNYFKDRSLYYATFPIQEQARRGDWDYRLAAVYTVVSWTLYLTKTGITRMWCTGSS